MIVLFLCLGFCYLYGKRKESIPTNSFVNDYVDIVYMDNEGTKIPVSIGISDEEDLVVRKVALLRNCTVNGLNSVFPEMVEVMNVDIESNILKLDMNESFLDIDKDCFMDMVEALTYTLCNEEIKGIRFLVNGNEILMLNDGSVCLDQVFTSVGINNFEMVSRNLYDSTGLVVYGLKTIEEQDYLVPMTKRINRNLSLKEKIEAIFEQCAISSGLDYISEMEKLEFVKEPSIENGVLTCIFSDRILNTNGEIDSKLITILNHSLKQLKGVDEIVYQVEGECYQSVEVANIKNINIIF